MSKKTLVAALNTLVTLRETIWLFVYYQKITKEIVVTLFPLALLTVTWVPCPDWTYSWQPLRLIQ